MMNPFSRCGDGRTCQNELTFLAPMVNLKAYGVPNLRNYLPLVYQPGILTFKKHFYPKIANSK